MTRIRKCSVQWMFAAFGLFLSLQGSTVGFALLSPGSILCRIFSRQFSQGSRYQGTPNNKTTGKEEKQMKLCWDIENPK